MSERADSDPAATIASLRATRAAMDLGFCLTTAEFPGLPGLLTEAAALIEAMEREESAVANCDEVLALRAKVAALEREAESYWRVIEDAMPYIPSSSFVAAEIEELEDLRAQTPCTNPAQEKRESQ